LDKALALEFNRRYGVNAVENALKIVEVVSKYKTTAEVFNMADFWTPPYSEEELSKPQACRKYTRLQLSARE
jgi:hypothetical protein